VEFTLFVKDVTGMVVAPRPGAPIAVSAEPLGFDYRTMRGVTARVFPLALLRAIKGSSPIWPNRLSTFASRGCEPERVVAPAEPVARKIGAHARDAHFDEAITGLFD
jgi:hypothetical protein